MKFPKIDESNHLSQGTEMHKIAKSLLLSFGLVVAFSSARADQLNTVPMLHVSKCEACKLNEEATEALYTAYGAMAKANGYTINPNEVAEYKIFSLEGAHVVEHDENNEIIIGHLHYHNKESLVHGTIHGQHNLDVSAAAGAGAAIFGQLQI